MSTTYYIILNLLNFPNKVYIEVGTYGLRVLMKNLNWDRVVGIIDVSKNTHLNALYLSYAEFEQEYKDYLKE